MSDKQFYHPLLELFVPRTFLRLTISKNNRHVTDCPSNFYFVTYTLYGVHCRVTRCTLYVVYIIAIAKTQRISSQNKNENK